MMIKAYHMVGSDEWSAKDRSAAIDEILEVGLIFPAIDRLDQREMTAECLTDEDRGSTILQKWPEATSKAFGALQEIALEKIKELPDSGFTHSLFNCADLIAGDLEVVFLSLHDWYSADNGFVFNAAELIRNGARYRPKDMLGAYVSAIEVVVNQKYRTVKQARTEIEAMIGLVKSDMQYSGKDALEIMKIHSKGGNERQELVWPGALPASMAIEVWRNGRKIKNREFPPRAGYNPLRID